MVGNKRSMRAVFLSDWERAMLCIIASSIVLLIISGSNASAIWSRHESIEWWTDLSDTVALLEISQTEKLESENKYWESQEVSCNKVEAFKGDCPKTIVLRHSYRRGEDKRWTPNERILFFKVREFQVHGTLRDSGDAAYWVNVSNPDANSWYHAPHNNDHEFLRDEEAILSLVKSRIERPEATLSTRRRGLIIPLHWYADPNEIVMGYSDFVRTADPEYKQVLIRQLKKREFREDAIYNLISYPGQETPGLILPYLSDNTKATTRIQKKTIKSRLAHILSKLGIKVSQRAEYKTVTYYPVRQAAYLALVLLGEKVERPQPYYDNLRPWLFKVGFENETYFPYGDWRRLQPPQDTGGGPDFLGVVWLLLTAAFVSVLILVRLYMHRRHRSKPLKIRT